MIVSEPLGESMPLCPPPWLPQWPRDENVPTITRTRSSNSLAFLTKLYDAWFGNKRHHPSVPSVEDNKMVSAGVGWNGTGFHGHRRSQPNSVSHQHFKLSVVSSCEVSTTSRSSCEENVWFTSHKECHMPKGRWMIEPKIFSMWFAYLYVCDLCAWGLSYRWLKAVLVVFKEYLLSGMAWIISLFKSYITKI